MAIFIPLAKYEYKLFKHKFFTSYTIKNQGTRPGFSCLLYLIFYATLLHPIKNLIRNLNPDLCLLLWCEGVSRVV